MGRTPNSKNNLVSRSSETEKPHLPGALPGAQVRRSRCLWEAMGLGSRLGRHFAASIRLKEGLRPRAALWSGLCTIPGARWRVGPWRMRQRGGGWRPALRQVRRRGCGALAFHAPRSTQERAKCQAQSGRTWKTSQCPGHACMVGVKSEGLGSDIYSLLPPGLLTQNQAGSLLRVATLTH